MGFPINSRPRTDNDRCSAAPVPVSGSKFAIPSCIDLPTDIWLYEDLDTSPRERV
jgi:hypothetical protein